MRALLTNHQEFGHEAIVAQAIHVAQFSLVATCER